MYRDELIFNSKEKKITVQYRILPIETSRPRGVVRRGNVPPGKWSYGGSDPPGE